MTRVGKFTGRALIWALLLLASFPARPQDGAARETATQWRDIAVDSARGQVLAAAPERNELWLLDLATGERSVRIPVGKGPSDIAVDEDRDVAAVINRLDKTVSIIDLGSNAVVATVSVGSGASSIASLGAGRFAVAETFADNIAVLDAGSTTPTYPFSGVPAVPTLLSHSAGTLAAVGKLDNRLYLFSATGGSPLGQVGLDFAPKTLVGAPDGFLVSGDGGSALLDTRGAIVARTSAEYLDAVTYGGSLVGVSSAGVTVLSPTLSIEEQLSSFGSERVAAANGWLIALSTTAGRWNVVQSGAATAVDAPVQAMETEPVPPPVVEEATPVAEVAPAPAPAPMLVEEATEDEEPLMMAEDAAAPAAAPEQEAETAKVAEVPAPVEADQGESSIMQLPAAETVTTDATPAPDSAADAPAPEDASRRSGFIAVRPVLLAPELSEEEQAAEKLSVADEIAGEASVNPDAPSELAVQAAAQGEASGKPAPGQYMQHPIQIEGVRAPRPTQRPSAIPNDQLSRESISSALIQPTEFGSTESGFQPPDWSQPLRDIEADLMTRDFEQGRMDLEGNVRLRLGDMLFQADEFSYSEDLGDLRAAGAVQITQQRSSLTAQTLTYEVPTPGDMPAPSILEPELTPEEASRQRLTLGRVYGQWVTVIEPTREFQAEEVDYNFLTSSGTFKKARGKAGLYYWGASELRVLGPADAEGDEVWVTTCDHDPPHYRIRMSSAVLGEAVGMAGKNARLEVLGAPTPFYLPRWRNEGIGGETWTLDFDSGRRAETGYYLNVGQRIEINPDLAVGPRVYVTEKEGVGFGGDIDYDYTKNPASRLYGGKGEAHGLYTTKDRGYVHAYHRWEYDEDLVLRLQLEHWGDEEFYKDFYYDQFKNRTSPRSFANLTYRQPTWIASGTARVGTHGFVRETESLPEAAFYLLDREIANRLHLSFDTVTGYYHREPNGDYATRVANVARLTYDWDPAQWLSITPFIEAEMTYYDRLVNDQDSELRLSGMAGVTAQSRFQRDYDGFWGFSDFRHIVVPSVTYSYRNDSNVDFYETPRFDALDNVPGRSRIESKLSNILLGRDGDDGEVWQVARLTLYQGNDFWNEATKSEDYEVEFDLRPRPWWGMQLVGEKHVELDDFDIDRPDSLERRILDLTQRLTPLNFDPDNEFVYNTAFGDYERMLAQVYYDNTQVGGNWMSRLGFAYTATGDQVYNREILYGAGYRINDKWGFGFEHRYDLEDRDLRSQTYEIRRTLHCWETAIRVRDRESGFDIDFEFNIIAFPGSRLKL